jgi:hypothetical protein
VLLIRWKIRMRTETSSSECPKIGLYKKKSFQCNWKCICTARDLINRFIVKKKRCYESISPKYVHPSAQDIIRKMCVLLFLFAAPSK